MTLEQQYNKVVEQNKQLQGELALANKVIELMAFGLNNYRRICKSEDITTEGVITEYKAQVEKNLSA